MYGLPAVAVGVAGQRPLDAVPGVAHRELGPLPGELGLALGFVPAPLEVVLHVLEAAARVTAARLPAVAVGRAVVVVARLLAGDVGTRREAGAPGVVVEGAGGVL